MCAFEALIMQLSVLKEVKENVVAIITVFGVAVRVLISR